MVPLKSLGTVSYSRAMVTGLIRVSSLCWRFVGYLYSVIIYLSSFSIFVLFYYVTIPTFGDHRKHRYERLIVVT